RYIGTGEAGCRERVLCDTNHGNCDLLSNCTDNAATGYADCGPCPAGYEGTGDTKCTDTDGCKLEPCFPGVMCTDVPAPGEGRTCGSCPEGYKGDGASCEVCQLLLSLDAGMQTIVEGTMKRSATNQLVGVFDGLSDPACVLTQGVQYLWSGVASDGSVVALDSDTNKRETLTLHFPRSTLKANLVLSMRLAASLRGDAAVSAVAEVSFEVQRQALVALIMGGEVQTGEGLAVVLDAGQSYDPDGEPGEMAYSWTCARVNATESLCRQASGEAMPAYTTTPALALELQGSLAGAQYVLTCAIAKADRSARASTTVTVLKGSPPVPSIVPLAHKHTANRKLTLSSQVTWLDQGALTLAWTLQPLEGAAAVDLAAVAATALNLPKLVLSPDALQAGGAYRFTLSATDANGPSHVSLRVSVNSPPFGGTLSVSPAEGTLGEIFAFEGSGWEDDVEDKPLWYQLRYEVVGVGGSTMMTQWQPSANFSQNLTAAGKAAHGHLVTMHLHVKDTLDAEAWASRNVTVQPMVFESADAQDNFVDSMLAGALQSVSNGQDASSTVLAMASVLGADGTGERRRRHLLGGALRNASSRRVGQREAMMEVTSAVAQQLRLTTDTVTRMAQTAALVAEEPAELSGRSRGLVTAAMDVLVAATGGGDPESQLNGAGAVAVVESLSGVTVGALGGANQSAEVGAAVEVVRAAGLSCAQDLAAGEDPVEAATEALSMRVQNDDLSSPQARAFTEDVDSLGGAALTLPSSVGAALGSAAERVTIMVVASRVDPHASPLGAGEPQEEGAEPGVAGAVTLTDSTSISLLSGINGSELGVSGLGEALNFTLPSRAPGVPTRCAFWDEALGGYSSEGCATLPNPAPPGAAALWRTRNVSALATLEAAWGVASGSGLEAGCEETWGAVHAEFRGTDAGLRKYVGEGCQLADPGNNASCWWEWRAARFEGPGCVWATEVGCLCTHLTDFAGAQETERGSLEAPEVETVETDDMARLSLASIGQSVVLLSVLCIFMIGAPMLFGVSNWWHNRERMSMLLTMVEPSFSTFSDLDGLWTWSIVDGATYAGGESRQRGSAGPSLGDRLLAIAEEEKRRLDDNRLGVSAPAALEAAAEEAEPDGDRPADPAADQGALHRKIASQQRRTSLFTNLLSTGTTLGELGENPAQGPGTADLADPGGIREEDGEPDEASFAGIAVPGDLPAVRDAPLPGGGPRQVASEAGSSFVLASTAPSCVASPGEGRLEVGAKPPILVRRELMVESEKAVEEKDTWRLEPQKVVDVDLCKSTVCLAPPMGTQAIEQARRVLMQAVADTKPPSTWAPKAVEGYHASPPGKPLSKQRLRSHDNRLPGIFYRSPRVRPMISREALYDVWPRDDRRDKVITTTKTITTTTTTTRTCRVPQDRPIQVQQISQTQILGTRQTLHPPRRYKTRNPPLQGKLAGQVALMESYGGSEAMSPTMRSALLGGGREDWRHEEEGGAPLRIGPLARLVRFAGSGKRKAEAAEGERISAVAREAVDGMRTRMGGYRKMTKMFRSASFSQKGRDAALRDHLAKKAKKSTAQALFTTINVNIYRLQLCIPLDYLETLAVLELRDDSRRRRVDSVSAFPRGAAEWASGGGAGPVAEGLEHSESSALMGLLGSRISVDRLKPDAAGEEEKGAEEGAANRALSSSLNSLRLINSRPSAPVLGGVDEEAGAAKPKATKMWKKLKLRQSLPVERMLGTALVQAFLGIKTLLSHKDLAKQAERASAAPWQMPNNRPFSWYVSVFKVLIGSVSREGWFHRANLWNLVFLQRVDGSFELSGHLARVLKAGSPLQDLVVNPVAMHDVQVLRDSIPRALRDVYCNDAVCETMQELWGTILVLAQLREYPYTWTENPNDPAEQQITLRARSQMFVDAQCRELPDLAQIMPNLRAEAAILVARWTEEFRERMSEAFEQLSPQLAGKKNISFWALSNADKRQRARLKLRKFSVMLKRNARWVAKAHPLSAIYMVGATEPFSRSERILTQTNTYVLMLTVTVWFFYSKSVTCCRDLRAHLECPTPFDVNEPCLGYGYCAALGSGGDMLPEELEVHDFICTAFPSGTYTDRFFVIMIIIGILTPVTLIISQLFTIAASAGIPEHWGHQATTKAEKVFGPKLMITMQTGFVTVYALFFNFQKFNKAIAVGLVGLITILWKGTIVKRAIHGFLDFLRWCIATVAYFHQLLKLLLFGEKIVTRYRTEAEKLLAEVHLVSPLEAHMQKVAYFLLLVSWFIITWVLLTYSMLIREMMGREAEAELIAVWATTLAVEMFGVEALKLICIRLFVDELMRRFEEAFTGVDLVQRWYERHIMQVAANSREGNWEDNGDQDLGDDADADGGEGFGDGDDPNSAPVDMRRLMLVVVVVVVMVPGVVVAVGVVVAAARHLRRGRLVLGVVVVPVVVVPVVMPGVVVPVVVPVVVATARHLRRGRLVLGVVVVPVVVVPVVMPGVVVVVVVVVAAARHLR
ncbi:hypothetical protein CYMTET_10953, partial [Cymbomonas tetramitiformis]